jgi:hypothetical protein
VGWLWLALGLVVGCDTNVLARLVAGQVVAVLGYQVVEPNEGDGECDDENASATPTLWSARPLLRPTPASGPVPATPLPDAGGVAHPPPHAIGLGLPAVPAPPHGGTAFPLLC